jgi:hypothetical protein
MGGEEAALRRRRGASSSPPGLHPGGAGGTRILASPPTNRLQDRFVSRHTGGAWEIERAWQRSCRRCRRRRPSVSASVSQGVEGLNLARGKSKAQITCGTGYAHLQWHAFTRDGVEATGVVLG